MHWVADEKHKSIFHARDIYVCIHSNSDDNDNDNSTKKQLNE